MRLIVSGLTALVFSFVVPVASAQTEPSAPPPDEGPSAPPAPAESAPAPATPSPAPTTETTSPAPAAEAPSPASDPSSASAAPSSSEASPPPPVEPPDEPKKEDEDSLEWVWANAEGGLSIINLKSFSETNLAIVDSQKTGGMLGFGAGLRLFFLTIGARARYHTAMNLWQIMGDVGLHLKVGRLDPYLAVRGGYDTVGSFSQSVSTAANGPPADVQVHGWNVGAALGLDVYLAHALSIGVEGSADFLFLQRPKPDLPAQFASLPPDQQAAIKNDPLYQNSGSSVGFGGVLSGHLGLHF